MPGKRGLLLECFLLVLGGWAGHPDDARAKGFGTGLLFHVVVHGWVRIRIPCAATQHKQKAFHSHSNVHLHSFMMEK